ncbi:MAG: sensor histidine kinase [Nannocystaceae bacterium]|nr:histidine kinase [bacterium]
MRGEPKRSWIGILVRHAAMHLVIAGSLTAFMIGARWSWLDLLITLVANLTFSACIGTVCTLVYGKLIPRLGATGWRRAVLNAVGFAASVAVGVELALVLLHAMNLELDSSRAIVWRFAGVVTIVVLIVTLGYDQLRTRARAVELREEHARRELVEAQLANLRARLNPHFLFNSLNTLAGLIEEDPPKAVEALERLSELLRHALENTTTRRTTLGAELDVLEDYLRMEQLRFGRRLRWSLDAEPEARSAPVPSLLLQPVVENAVKFAVAPRREGGLITITARAIDGRVRLEVGDDGPGHADSSSTGLGDRTLRQRLALEYGTEATLAAGPRPSGGYLVTLDLPVEEGKR